MINIADYYRADPNAFQKGFEGVNALRQNVARAGAGSALAGGDFEGAANALYRGGEVEAGAAIAARGDQQSRLVRKDRDDRHDALLKHTADVASRLDRVQREFKDPARTLQAFDQLAPSFLQLGETAEEVAQIRAAIEADPDVTLITLGANASKGLGRDVKVVGNEALVFENGELINRYGSAQPNWKERTREDGSTEWFDLNAFGSGNPPPASSPTPQRQPGPASGGPAPAGNGQPRNVRNNNPGNIKDGKFAQSLPGYAGSDGTFAIFDSRDAGHGAQVSLLKSYGERGFNSVKAIIDRWAPPSDNNPTPAYVNFVAGKLGVDPSQPLDMADPRVVSGLALAIQEFEGGGPAQPYKVAALGDTPPPPGPRAVPGSAPKAKPRERRMTADEVAAAGYQPGSVVMMNPETGEETVKQGPGAGSGKITDGMRNVASYANDMLAANTQINELAQGGNFRPTAQVLVSEKNGVTRLVARNPQDAQFVQAANAWLLPLLRKETGAAVTVPELTTYMDTYIPLPSDDDDTVRQKAASRRRKMLSLIQQSRPAFLDQFGEVPTEVTTYAPKRKGGTSVAKGPPAEAVAHLRANPNLRQQFDGKYGQGAAAKVLGR